MNGVWLNREDVEPRFQVCLGRRNRVLSLDCVYSVVPRELLTFLGFLGNAEFSPWKRLPEY